MVVLLVTSSSMFALGQVDLIVNCKVFTQQLMMYLVTEISFVLNWWLFLESI